MQKNSTLNVLATSVMLGALIVSGLTACTKESDVPEQVVYEVCIHAANGNDAQTRAVTFDGTTSTSIFRTDERVYVCNKTTGVFLEGYLQPTNLLDGNTKCDLVGSLTGTISQNDQLVLLYNLNEFSSSLLSGNLFNYSGQNGLASGVLDGAMATVTATVYDNNKLIATEIAEFENMQSIFRFKFIDENNNPINVATLRIYSENKGIAKTCRPLNTPEVSYGGATSSEPVVVTLPSPTTDYIYVAMGIRESYSAGDVIKFIAFDNNGEEYRGTKSAPSSGFINGKYYYNSSAIQLTKINYMAPTITWTSVKNGVPVEPAYRRYLVHGQDGNPSVITISGNSYGYYFYMYDGSTITISNLTATLEEVVSAFISAPSSYNINLIVDGVNSIACLDYQAAIYISGSLKLSGNGTLTVRSQNSGNCGLRAAANYDYSSNNHTSTGETDVTDALAAEGFTVTRSALTDNSDGTFTWTYTVTPINYVRTDYPGNEWQ